MIRRNKRAFGAVAGIFIGLAAFIILAFLIAIFSGLAIKISGDLTNSVVTSAPQDLNFKNTTILTAGNVNQSIQQMTFFSWIFIIAMAIGFLIAAYMLKPSAITIFFWFLISAGMFLVGVFISRAYEDLYNKAGYLGDALHLTQTGTSWLIIYMPHLIVVLAFIGGIILYMRLKKQEADFI